jgi:hypothetical protein
MSAATTPTALAQCLDCLYSETLETTYSGKLVLSAVHFHLSADRVLRHKCGGRVRLWTGMKEGFPLTGVIEPPTA